MERKRDGDEEGDKEAAARQEAEQEESRLSKAELPSPEGLLPLAPPALCCRFRILNLDANTCLFESLIG